jgi:hypothetical protein
MATFDDLLAQTPWNDLVVQRALGEIDTSVLALALVDLTEETRAIFYRNMSRRASHLVREQVDAKHGAHPARIRAARELLTGLLQEQAASADGEEPPAGGDALPEISVESPEALIATFRSLADYVRRHGFLPLEGLEPSITHPLLRRGIEFLVDGTDPLVIRSILEKYQETYLQQAKAFLTMIVEGIDSLAERNLPTLVEARLRAHVARDWPRG